MSSDRTCIVIFQSSDVTLLTRLMNALRTHVRGSRLYAAREPWSLVSNIVLLFQSPYMWIFHYNSIVTSISLNLSLLTNGTAALFKPISEWSTFWRLKKHISYESERICSEFFLINTRHLIIVNTHYIWLTINENRKNFRHFYALFIYKLSNAKKKRHNPIVILFLRVFLLRY